jgi:hypothetical protein
MLGNQENNPSYRSSTPFAIEVLKVLRSDIITSHLSTEPSRKLARSTCAQTVLQASSRSSLFSNFLCNVLKNL